MALTRARTSGVAAMGSTADTGTCGGSPDVRAAGSDCVIAPLRQTLCMQFSSELRDRVASGAITLSFRLWSRPKVKVGGVYRTGFATIEIDEVELVPFSSINEDDLAQTGETDLESLRRRAAHAGPIDDDTLVYRVEFHLRGSE